MALRLKIETCCRAQRKAPNKRGCAPASINTRAVANPARRPTSTCKARNCTLSCELDRTRACALHRAPHEWPRADLGRGPIQNNDPRDGLLLVRAFLREGKQSSCRQKNKEKVPTVQGVGLNDHPAPRQERVLTGRHRRAPHHAKTGHTEGTGRDRREQRGWRRSAARWRLQAM